MLHSGIVTVDDLFGGRIQFKIPVYQRHYVWSKVDQWEPLWQDIEEKIEVNAKVEIDQDRTPHFVGAIVTRQLPRTVGGVPGYDIIDGQQRLTTFQIILCAISDVCRSVNLEDLSEQADEFVLNSGLLAHRFDSKQLRNPDEKYKLIPTQTDRTFFEALIDGKVDKSGGTIRGAYNFFRSKIKKYMTTEDSPHPKDDRNRMMFLLDTILMDFQVVQILIDSHANSERIFESINARGRTINEFDHLRNNIFLKARVSGKDVEDLHEKHWLHFEDEYWTKKLEATDEEMLVSERFLQHFLMAKLKKDSIAYRDLFYTYDREYRTDLVKDKGVEFEFLELKKYSKVYRVMLDCSCDSDGWDEFHSINRMKFIAQRMEFYEHLKITSLHPFILFIVNELEISLEELERVFNILESYTMRRLLCSNQGIDNYSELFAGIIRSIGKGNWNSAELGGYLSRLQAPDKWPSDDDVRRALERCGDASVNRVVTRYILYRIELFKAASDSTLREELKFSGRLTREHVMPIQWQENWPLQDPQNSELVKEREDAIQSIGNLTLLTREFNKELGNQAFSEKQNALLKNSDLKITQEIVYESMDSFQTRNTWDVTEIFDREEKLWQCFCDEIWPGARSFVVWYFGELKHWHPNITDGFIIDEDGEEIPVKASAFQYSDLPSLRKGTKVKFEKMSTENGSRAIKVLKIE